MSMSPNEIDQVVVMRERDHWRAEYNWAVSELRHAAYDARDLRASISGQLKRVSLAGMTEAIIEHDLTRAEILVWSHVESIGNPENLTEIVLEETAETLRVNVSSVRRAVRRLSELGLIEAEFTDNRHHVGPVTA